MIVGEGYVGEQAVYTAEFPDASTTLSIPDSDDNSAVTFVQVQQTDRTLLTPEVIDEVIGVLTTGKVADPLDELLYTFNPDGDHFENVIRAIRTGLEQTLKEAQ